MPIDAATISRPSTCALVKPTNICCVISASVLTDLGRATVVYPHELSASRCPVLTGPWLATIAQKRIVEFDFAAAPGAFLEVSNQARRIVFSKPRVSRNPRPHTLCGVDLVTARSIIAVMRHQLERGHEIGFVRSEHQY